MPSTHGIRQRKGQRRETQAFSSCWFSLSQPPVHYLGPVLTETRVKTEADGHCSPSTVHGVAPGSALAQNDPFLSHELPQSPYFLTGPSEKSPPSLLQVTSFLTLYFLCAYYVGPCETGNSQPFDL